MNTFYFSISLSSKLRALVDTWISIRETVRDNKREMRLAPNTIFAAVRNSWNRRNMQMTVNRKLKTPKACIQRIMFNLLRKFFIWSYIISLLGLVLYWLCKFLISVAIARNSREIMAQQVSTVDEKERRKLQLISCGKTWNLMSTNSLAVVTTSGRRRQRLKFFIWTQPLKGHWCFWEEVPSV